MAQQFEIGIMTLGEITPDPVTGRSPSAQTRMRETLEAATLADQVGLDVFGVGEHHRSDFFVSAPPVVLSAIATRTERIRLASAVTVLSSDDPIRVFQDFATLDLISGGRAEIIAGRGSYTESFPLFGYDLADYSDLFREKLDALLAIRAGNPARWPGGRFTHALTGLDIAPRPLGELPVWVGVGGTPASAVRTGTLGLPLALALLLGPVDSFVRPVELYRQAAADAGHDVDALRISVSTGGFVGATSQGARDTMYPAFRVGMMENNHQRGAGFALPRPAFDAQTAPAGGMLVGSPQEVIDKIMRFHLTYGLDRVVLQMGFGGVPHAEHLAAIERLGTEVAPVVRREVERRAGAAA
ncbi:LLM class flavin-dependent oxidoreductase [Promicromonospora thailandica]|uniref:Oxidoreductase, LLM family n=1 Tax=Promicromonospora thailandica TaxID=765201 RepID=A0A9X2JZ14_9MICO|nr:LLM class flavin-dependent oxidoreductase [Promicromonospora thailandica]MCP2265624.1 putative oxidoreductase, LLM family [Promicromonospora thailandica]